MPPKSHVSGMTGGEYHHAQTGREPNLEVLKKKEGEHLYSAYGLTISAHITCPELPPGEGEPDVIIRYGRVPESLEDATVKGSFFQSSPDRFLLNVNGVARYLITSGRKITIEAGEDTAQCAIRLFLLGSAFGALLHQRGYLVIHGSALRVAGSAVVFTGDSGAGKSTLAAAFCKNGYDVLSDDLCVIAAPAEGSPALLPGYPQLKIWADAAEMLAEKIDTLRRVGLRQEKYGLPLQERFFPFPLPLTRIYVLERSDSDRLMMKELLGRDKMETLLKNTYRFGFLEGQGLKPLHFRQCAAAASAVEIKQVVRSRDGFRLDELVSFIERDLLRPSDRGGP